MMGGRAAESLIFNTSTNGAENDLKQITKLARKMVLDWGMSDKFGHMAFGGQREEVFLGEELGVRREYSDGTAREIDEEVKHILENSYTKAEETLKKHRDLLEKVAEELLEKEEVSGEWVEELINKEGVRSGAIGVYYVLRTAYWFCFFSCYTQYAIRNTLIYYHQKSG